MALTLQDYEKIREELDNCKKPLFLFDDDQDGLCSFLLLYKYKKEGKGIIVKTSPRLDDRFARKVEEYQPDKVFVLDIAVLQDDFTDNVHVPIIWIDHHGPADMTHSKVKYFNPKVENKEHNYPTSYLCYNVVKENLWLGATGSVADWFLPEFLEEFKKNYPGLIDASYQNPGDIIYTTKLGHLIRVLSFALKGHMGDVKKAISAMMKIEEPEEILEQTTSRGKLVYKRFQSINKEFTPLIKGALHAAKQAKDDVVLFTYHEDQTSFTSDICNELTYRYPEKVILVCRQKSGDMRCSLRSTQHDLPTALEKSLAGLKGYGGGHRNACGLNVSKDHFDEFLKRLKEELSLT